VVEHLPGKCEALRANPVSPQKERTFEKNLNLERCSENTKWKNSKSKKSLLTLRINVIQTKQT
jgi:hypothetical protein